MTTLTQDQHDRAVRFIAANRYPFPDQPHPSWPLHYRTWVNTATHPRRSIETPDGPHFPDIMIVDGENAKTAAVVISWYVHEPPTPSAFSYQAIVSS